MDEKKIYIAGKVTGLPWPEVVAKFQKAEDWLHSKGWVNIVNPTKICKEDTPWKEAMKTCIKALVECDCICMLTCWVNSPGAKLEFKIATTLDIKVVGSTI